MRSTRGLTPFLSLACLLLLHFFLLYSPSMLAACAPLDIPPPSTSLELLRTDETRVFSKFQIRFANLLVDYSMSGQNMADNRRQCSDSTKLFIIVPTRPGSFDVREHIRQSWAAQLPDEVVLKFVVGLPEEEDMYELLIGEMEKRGDLIVYNQGDTYENLYLKIYAALQWQQAYCPGAGYVLKADDDAVIEVERLLYWIEQKFSKVVAKHPAAVFGHMWHGTLVNHDPSAPKWYVSKEAYEKQHYPEFFNGPTYLLSGPAVRRILGVAPHVNGFTVEDALFTGVLAEKAGVTKIDAAEHFRTDMTIRPVERCDGGVPLVFAIYAVPKPSMFNAAYAALKSAKCS